MKCQSSPQNISIEIQYEPATTCFWFHRRQRRGRRDAGPAPLSLAWSTLWTDLQSALKKIWRQITNHTPLVKCSRYIIPDSVLLAGLGKRPPRGKPASPGSANCLVDRARSSRIAEIANKCRLNNKPYEELSEVEGNSPAFLSSIFSNLTKHCTACNVRYIRVLSAPPRTSKLRKRTFARKYMRTSSIISSFSAGTIWWKDKIVGEEYWLRISCWRILTRISRLSRTSEFRL